MPRDPASAHDRSGLVERFGSQVGSVEGCRNDPVTIELDERDRVHHCGEKVE
jgi:hypothetical protein